MASKDVISTDRAPGPFQGAPYNQAIRVGDLVFVAGQLGIVLESGELAGETVEEQTEQIMRNMSAILEAAGSGLDKLVKTTVFLLDLADFAGDERGLREARRRPTARALDDRHLAAPERRPRRDRSRRAHVDRRRRLARSCDTSSRLLRTCPGSRPSVSNAASRPAVAAVAAK